MIREHIAAKLPRLQPGTYKTSNGCHPPLVQWPRLPNYHQFDGLGDNMQLPYSEKGYPVSKNRQVYGWSSSSWYAVVSETPAYRGRSNYMVDYYRNDGHFHMREILKDNGGLEDVILPAFQQKVHREEVQ